MQPRNELLERSLAFVRSDNIDALLEVEIRPFGRIRPAGEDKLHAVLFGDLRHAKYVVAGNDVCVDSDNLRLQTPHRLLEVRGVTKSGIEHVDGKTGALQICRQVENAERRIRLHHAPFDDVVFQKVGMRQQNICHKSKP